MRTVEATFLWMALATYALSFVFFLIGLMFNRQKLITAALALAMIGVLFHTGTLSARWIGSGHPPLKDNYENAITLSWTVMAFFLFIAFRTPSFRGSGPFIIPLALLILGYAAVIFSPYTPLTPTYKSVWLWIHVLFACIAYGSLTIACGMSILYVVKAGSSKKGLSNRWLKEKIPPLEQLDRLVFQYVVVGFLTLGAMIASGAIWAGNLWGRYWSWDPVETWSLITWLAYGLYLHLRLTLGWKGTRLAWIAILALIGVLMAFWGVQLIPSSYHLYIRIGRGRF